MLPLSERAFLDTLAEALRKRSGAATAAVAEGGAGTDPHPAGGLD